MLLHSAAVQVEGKGVILPGKTGAGKSTLTSWLIRHGCNYLSDEMAYVPGGSNSFSGFARPITIKAAARHLLPELLKKRELGSNMLLHSEPVDMIAPELFGAQVVTAPSPLDLIIFPQFQTDQDVELAQLSNAQTAFELMKCLANARNLSDHGLSEAARLAKSTPALSLRYGDTDEAGRSILGHFLK